MKALEKNVAKHERRAKRTLAKKQAKKLEHQAAKFREDALKLGLELQLDGSKIYKVSHPAYEEMILPLLERAASYAQFYGFNALFQVQTPLPSAPLFTNCLGTIDSNTASPTMLGCIELIEKRPVMEMKDGKPVESENPSVLSQLLAQKDSPSEPSE